MHPMKAVLGAALLLIPLLARAEVVEEQVHLLARQSAVLSDHGIQVPKVYVLSASGEVIFEGKASKFQAYEPILEALRSGKTSGRKDAHLLSLLEDAGFEPSATGVPVMVSIEIGKSIGVCPSCDPYYPDLARFIHEHDPDARWLRLVFEKNDYKPEG